MKLDPFGGIELFTVVAHPQSPAVVKLNYADVNAVALLVGKAVLDDIFAQLLHKEREHHGFLF